MVLLTINTCSVVYGLVKTERVVPFLDSIKVYVDRMISDATVLFDNPGSAVNNVSDGTST